MAGLEVVEQLPPPVEQVAGLPDGPAGPTQQEQPEVQVVGLQALAFPPLAARWLVAGRAQV